ncbi:hypothetical protein [Nonlabens xiamenensis]|uniref:hypothetical protein n=1 Tax=Nonlabens xiamenensis TaxID=2341043 RepID=UPI000F605ACA|nr:hypothetical protein [Nonlabens xiamenensis]
MTSIIGQWKLCWLLVIVGISAFAKANSTAIYPPSTMNDDQVRVFTINAQFDRNQIFDLIRELKEAYSITCKISGYQRSSGVTSKLGLNLISDQGNEFSILAEDKNGIKDICLKIDIQKNLILYFDYCDLGAKNEKPAQPSVQKMDEKPVQTESDVSAQRVKEPHRPHPVKKQEAPQQNAVDNHRKKMDPAADTAVKLTTEQRKTTTRQPNSDSNPNHRALEKEISATEKQKARLSDQAEKARKQKIEEEMKLQAIKERQALIEQAIEQKSNEEKAHQKHKEALRKRAQAIQEEKFKSKRVTEELRLKKLEEEKRRILQEVEALRKKAAAVKQESKRT